MTSSQADGSIERKVAPKIVVIFDHLGPYHIARLEATARNVPLSAIECSSVSFDYSWERVRQKTTFRWITLFEHNQNRRIPLSELTQKTRSTLGREQPDVVAIPGWWDRIALIALRWGLERNIPVLVMSDSTAIDAKRYWLKEFVKRRILALTGAAFTGGERSSRYINQLGMPSTRVFVGYDVVDNAYFMEGARQAQRNEVELRRLLCLPRRYFLASARFVHKKNLSTLLKAYAAYKARGAKDLWKLVILGDGPLRDVLYQECNRLGLDDDVIFPGFVQYGLLPTYYGLADAFVHVSAVEQWGLVVNEALAAGLPVLVSNRCGCVPELVKDGHNGFMFDPFDVDQLARLLERVSGHRERHYMGNNSQQIVSRWSLDTFAKGIIQAAEAALEFGLSRPTLIDSVLLRTLPTVL
jgi:1,2-diacylglycerol 3-alpha-glucosyltransferase